MAHFTIHLLKVPHKANDKLDHAGMTIFVALPMCFQDLHWASKAP